MNVWGQTEAVEGRELMMTGLFGPQTDLNRLPNWGRGHQTGGEDPFLSGSLVGQQINGIQAKGFMSEMKHFLMYNGQNQNTNSDVQDQAAHELYFTPYEHGFVDGRAAATMCSYQIWRDVPTPNQGDLPSVLTQPASSLAAPVPGYSPFASATDNPLTWPLNESHFSCEQPLSLTYVLRGLWGSAAMVGTDYPAQHSTSGIFQGMEQEMPTTNGFMAGGNGTNDPTGSTCATTRHRGDDAHARRLGTVQLTRPIQSVMSAGSRTTSRARPAPAARPRRARPARAAARSTRPCSTASCRCRVVQPGARARALPGGALRDARLRPDPTRDVHQPRRHRRGPQRQRADPGRPDGGASPSTDLGTENGDAGVAELTAEEGAVLFKNANRASGATPELPIQSSDLTSNNIFVDRGRARSTLIASPSREASQGFPDRIAINPLSTLGSRSAATRTRSRTTRR